MRRAALLAVRGAGWTRNRGENCEFRRRQGNTEMNAFLLAAASLGAMFVSLTRTPDQLVDPAAADDAEVARLMAAAPDVGEQTVLVIFDPRTGAATEVKIFGFSEG